MRSWQADVKHDAQHSSVLEMHLTIWHSSCGQDCKSVECASSTSRLHADTPLPRAPEWVTRTSAGNHPPIPEVVIDGHSMRDVAYQNAPLAVARKMHIIDSYAAMGYVGKYSTVLQCLAYASGHQEYGEWGPFEVLHNHQDFAWRAQQDGCCAVPQLAVQVGYAMYKQLHCLGRRQKPLYVAVADLGPGRGLVPGGFKQTGYCQVSWGNSAHTCDQFWVMCWHDVLPIIQDGLILKKMLQKAAVHQPQLQPAARMSYQQMEQDTSHLQPSICSLDENVLHIIMGHLVGEQWVEVIQKVWNGRPTSREEAQEICVGAGIPAELCKAWWPRPWRSQRVTADPPEGLAQIGLAAMRF